MTSSLRARGVKLLNYTTNIGGNPVERSVVVGSVMKLEERPDGKTRIVIVDSVTAGGDSEVAEEAIADLRAQLE